jgi:hypothetical protein
MIAMTATLTHPVTSRTLTDRYTAWGPYEDVAKAYATWGPYEDVAKAYAACRAWLDDHGLEPAGPHWEVYRTDPSTEPDPARWRTDVVLPFRAATA